MVANDLHRPLSTRKDIVGQICESTDCIAKDRLFPDVVPGDTIAVFNAGAYVSSMSSTYNGRGRPEEIMVDGNIFNITRKRDTFSDFIEPYGQFSSDGTS